MSTNKFVGKFGKKSINSFTDTKCARQLYIHLGNHDTNWLKDPNGIITRSRVAASGQVAVLTDAGKTYERAVYNTLLAHHEPHLSYTLNPPHSEDLLKDVYLDKAEFLALYARVERADRILMLEHQWPLTRRFIRNTFHIADNTIPTRGNDPSKEEGKNRVIRPDLMVIHKLTSDEDVQELCADGTVKIISREERQTRWAINIIDIKHTPADSIGHRHFAEILFYARSLALLIEEYGLTDKFFVHANGNGILGKVPTANLVGSLWNKLVWTPAAPKSSVNSQLLYQPFLWTDLSSLWDNFESTVQELWNNKDSVYNKDHRAAPLCIQPACGRCPFIDDCVDSLTTCGSPVNLREPDLDTSDWNVQLLPNIKPALVHELNNHGIRTIGELINQIHNIDFNNEISPLYAEKETLYLKAKALHTLKAATPEKPEEFQSALLPYSLNMGLLINLETQQPDNIVFAFGLKLTIGAPINSHTFGSKALNEAHITWWNAWIEVLKCIDFDDLEEEDCTPELIDKIDLSSIYDVLDVERYATHHTRYFKPSRKAKTDAEKKAEKEIEKDKWRAHFTDNLEGMTKKMLHGLCVLKINETLKRKSQLGLRNSDTDITYHVTEVALNTASESEYALFERLINQLYHILNICHATEVLVIGQDDKGTYTHNFAGFYWAPQQIEHLFELVNRHYETMVVSSISGQSHLLERFEQVQDFINPSSSNIRHSQYHKKLYDIQAFFQQGIALPAIISYSWHDMITLWDPSFTPNRRFWAPLFNFMDFTIWSEFVSAKTSTKQRKIHKKIEQQMTIKLDSIDTILQNVHKQARTVGIIPSESQTIDTPGFLKNSFTRANFNSIAKLWVGLNDLNVSTQKMEVDNSRLTWSNYSIAKLKSAKVDDLQLLPDDPNDDPDITPSRLQFFIPEMSSNVKIAEGNVVQLLNLEHRNARQHWKLHSKGSMFKIESMRWTTTYKRNKTGFVVVGSMVDPYSYGKPKATSHTRYDLWQADNGPTDAIFHHLSNHKTRYLYSLAGDYWTGPLKKLLNRFNLGYSPLAEVLSLKTGLRTRSLPDLSNTIVTAPEIYLYWPQLIPPPSSMGKPPLRSQIYFPPDNSQQRAIETVFNHTITCIEGPPGTGKSQTIVSLIDEFIHRFERPPKILVTAFSFAALQVVADKIANAWEGDENDPERNIPSVRKLPMLLGGSEERFSIQSTHPDQPEPILLTRETTSRWRGTTQTTSTTITSGSKKRLFGNMLKEFGHDPDGGFILFANAYLLQHVGLPHTKKKFNNLPNDFGFDLIIIDEASQMPTSQLLAATQLVKPFEGTLQTPSTIKANNVQEVRMQSPPKGDDPTRFVLVGDHNQLPPVSPVKPPEKLRHLVDSAFYYYLMSHADESAKVSLESNYRSHADIVECIRKLGLYTKLLPFKNHGKNLDRIPSPVPNSITQSWLRTVLERDNVVNTILHNSPLDTVFSKREAELTIEVILAFFTLKNPTTVEEEDQFWDEQIGVVSPHNAHGSLIIRGVQHRLTRPTRRTNLNDDELQSKLQKCVASVDKFQGSARDFIIGTMGISAEDQLQAEETFFYDINRFNVLISRAKSKMLLICSENFASYTPRDMEILPVASKIKQYVNILCHGDGQRHSLDANTDFSFEVRTMPSSKEV